MPRAEVMKAVVTCNSSNPEWESLTFFRGGAQLMAVIEVRDYKTTEASGSAQTVKDIRMAPPSGAAADVAGRKERG